MDALKRILVEDEYLIASDIKSAVEQHGAEEIGRAQRLPKRFHNPALTRLPAEMVPAKG
jgi:hypothetical protein